VAGLRRVAVLAAALLLLTEAWATADSPTQQTLLKGAAVVFVTDAALDPGRREGGVVSIHLRDPLVFEGAVLAPAGTKAEIVIGSVPAANGKRRPVYTIERFSINAGLLPVRASEPIVPPLPAGAAIAARTEAPVDHVGGRWSVRLPFPFALGGDAPASAYTPTPARTPPPFTINTSRGRRGATPTPAPTVAPTPEPAITPYVPETPTPPVTPAPSPSP